MSFQQLVECIYFYLPGKGLGIYFHIASVICDDQGDKSNLLSDKVKFLWPNRAATWYAHVSLMEQLRQLDPETKSIYLTGDSTQ